LTDPTETFKMFSFRWTIELLLSLSLSLFLPTFPPLFSFLFRPYSMTDRSAETNFAD